MSLITVSDENKSPAVLITDTLNTIGIVATQPKLVQVNGFAAGTTVEIQARIHPNAAWVVIKALTDTDGDYIETFTTLHNFVQVVRLTGAAEILAYAQYLFLS